jgi:hypothetical protein
MENLLGRQLNYTVHTSVYDGPLDLLLNLIEHAELDITAVSLAMVTDQYLTYINGVEEINADEISASIVPDLSISNLDKTSLWRTAETAPVEFPCRRDIERLVHDEGPHLARFLLDYSIPKEWVGTARFGVRAYHEESLMQVAEQSSRNAGALEILEDWRSNYFSDNPAKPSWTGTSYKLLKELHKDDLAREAGLRGITVSSLGQHLSALKSKGVAWIDSQTTATERLWTIRRADPVSAALLPTGKAFSK